MKIGSQPIIPQADITGARPLQDLKELPLESMSPQQLSQVRGYLSHISEGTEKLHELTPNPIPELNTGEHVKLQEGYSTLSEGGNIRQLLSDRVDIRDKVAHFVHQSKEDRKLAPIPAPPAPTVSDPVRIFLENFDRWDTNHDGFLDRAELGRLLQDTSLTPEQGAAVSVIYERTMAPRTDQDHPENNESNLLADGKLSKDEVRGITNRGQDYRNALDKIRNSAQRAFVGPPDGDSIRQGRHGSCGFLAALVAMAENDPAAIRRMIRENGDGSWNVTFPGRPPVKVTLSPAERALGASSDAQGGQNGLWVAILEKAYAQVQAGPNSPDPLAIYQDGEDEQRTTEVLTGQKARRIELRATGLMGLMQPIQVRSAIEAAILAGRPITCSLFSNDNPWRLPSSHAYSVLNIRGDNLTIRNPWGDTGGEGAPNPNTRWRPDGQMDGRITVSLTDFVRYFREVVC